jgi:hypothetical protein
VLFVSHPLKQDEKIEGTRKQTDRYQDAESHGTQGEQVRDSIRSAQINQFSERNCPHVTTK